MRVYHFRHLGAAAAGARWQGSAGAGLNDARTLLTAPILCQRVPRTLAAAPASASRTCLNATL